MRAPVSRSWPATWRIATGGAADRDFFRAISLGRILLADRHVGQGLFENAALKAELLLVTTSAQRLGLNLNVAYVPETFNHPNRGLFDHVYMEALFKYGVEQAQKGTGFASTADALQRRSESAR